MKYPKNFARPPLKLEKPLDMEILIQMYPDVPAQYAPRFKAERCYNLRIYGYEHR
jgi:hypothetical protein